MKNSHVHKGAKEDKVSRVMREFSNGTLKTPQGKPVTDKNQALAIALNAAGLSNKSLKKAELLSKTKVLKSQLSEMIRKEQDTGKTLRQELLAYLKGNPAPKDTDVHAIAEKHGVPASEVEQLLYRILAEFFHGGRSKGVVKPVDPEELKMGIAVEQEHTKDPAMTEKIARDHLAEDPKYYSKLKEMEKK